MVLRKRPDAIADVTPDTDTPKIEIIVKDKTGSHSNWAKLFSSLTALVTAALAIPAVRRKTADLGRVGYHKVTTSPRVQRGVQKITDNPKVRAGTDAVTAVCGPRVQQARTVVASRVPAGLRRGSAFPAASDVPVGVDTAVEGSPTTRTASTSV